MFLDTHLIISASQFHLHPSFSFLWRGLYFILFYFYFLFFFCCTWIYLETLFITARAWKQLSSVQFRSVTQPCLTLCNPMDLQHARPPALFTTLRHIFELDLMYKGFPSGSEVKNPPVMQEMWVQSLGWEDSLQENMVTHSSILAWRIPWTEEPEGLQSIASQRVGHDWSSKAHTDVYLKGGISACF